MFLIAHPDSLYLFLEILASFPEFQFSISYLQSGSKICDLMLIFYQIQFFALNIFYLFQFMLILIIHFFFYTIQISPLRHHDFFLRAHTFDLFIFSKFSLNHSI